ncbi:MAG: alkaline phosphatase family protein [Actinomycetota bacterium]|nr:alkaline phosphatase family protein [Actinomycetota bacterium]
MKTQKFLIEPNLVDLSKTVINTVLGKKFYELRFNNLLDEKINDAESINFILADGLGFKNLQETDSWLNSNISKSIFTTFPSSTNVALSSLTLANNPGKTGIIGYFMFDKKYNHLINALVWNSENTNLIKNEFYKKQKTIWSTLNESKIFYNIFQPKNLVGTTLSNFIYFSEKVTGYLDNKELIELMSDSLFLENRFNFIYYPKIDVAAHLYGVGSKEWSREIFEFEKLINILNTSTNKKSYTVVTSDHGLVNITKNNKFEIQYSEDIKIYGDQRSVFINGEKNKINRAFKNVPGELINKAELKEYFEISEDNFIERIFPDFCFLLKDSSIVIPKHLKAPLIGYHGGLSDSEILIPIIEISNY